MQAKARRAALRLLPMLLRAALLIQNREKAVAARVSVAGSFLQVH